MKPEELPSSTECNTRSQSQLGSTIRTKGEGVSVSQCNESGFRCGCYLLTHDLRDPYYDNEKKDGIESVLQPPAHSVGHRVGCVSGLG